MYKLALLQATLQICIAADFAAESLLKFSSAVNDGVWGSTLEEAVGDSHTHEQYVPAPPGFSAVASPDQEFTFGLKSKVAETRGDRKLLLEPLDRQEPTPEEISWSGRTARKFESFGQAPKQQQQKFPHFKKQENKEQQQWDKIYDTFNNWDDDVNDDWNNRLDHEAGASDTRQDDWSDDTDNHFADFQFEIKKLSEMYSGSGQAPGRTQSSSSQDKSLSSSRHQAFSSGDRNNVRNRGTPRPRYSDLRRHEETTRRPDNYNQLRPSEESFGRVDNYNMRHNSQSYERPEFQWAKAEVTTRAPVFKNRNMVSTQQEQERPVRMRRPLTPAQTSGSLGVLPAPAEFQDNTRRVSGHFYDDTDTANFQFDPSPSSFENSYQYKNNPIGNEFQQNDIWSDIEKNAIYQTPEPEQNSVDDRYPYPYQKPAFNEPEFEYDISPISPVSYTKDPEAVYRIKPKTNVKRKIESVKQKPTNSFLDEATLILSEPHTSRGYSGLKKSSASVPTPTKVRAEAEDTSSSLKERPRGYRRVEDSYRDYRQTVRGPGSQEPRIPDTNRAIKRMEDSVGGESYHHGVAPDHHGGLEAAVVAGANHYRAEHYDQPQRLAFQIHGQEGPKSYRFGHDTGVGHNRQFRYEERDANGVVHGRYGYYDQHGKLQVVNYTADPYKGFHAEGEHVPQPQYRR